MPVITLEEHFTTREFQKAIASFFPQTAESRLGQERLLDLGDMRLAAMDAGSVAMQVLSLSALGFDKLDPATVTALCRDANDELASAVERYPQRFAGFATLNLLEPSSSAREMERCVRILGFRGALVHGHTGGALLDDAKFLPLWEMADALQVPVYLHPAPPPKAVYDVYYAGLPGATSQALSIAAWGWHTETGLHVLRLILSGLFDRFPRQQVIVGHMGENLPFSLARAATVLGPAATHLHRSIPEYFHQNIHVTTSGYFTQPPFECALEVVGIDRLLYSVDYPFSETTTGKDFLDATRLTPDDMDKFTYGNAQRLLKLPV